MRKLLAGFLFASALSGAAGCASTAKPTTTFVKVDQVSLGKVVVYRNGVAFYERRAQVEGGKLTVRVPRDRVDDFLKSLTVVDAKTGKPLPASFPRQQSDGGPFLEMTLDIPTAKEPGQVADVVLTYVTEAPVWKPSYRIAISDSGKVYSPPGINQANLSSAAHPNAITRLAPGPAAATQSMSCLG